MSSNNLQNTRTIVIVDQLGNELDTRQLINTAGMELYPQIEPIIIIDWMYDGKRPTLEQITSPVVYEGVKYWGNKCWGSAIKTGQTFGLPENVDPLASSGLLKTAERTIMSGRMLMSEGLYGGFVGEFTALVAKRGTKFGAHLVDDGFGFIRRSVADLYHSGQTKITLGAARGSYMIEQRLPWDAVKDELKPAIEESLLDMKAGDWAFRDDEQGRPEITQERRELVELPGSVSK